MLEIEANGLTTISNRKLSNRTIASIRLYLHILTVGSYQRIVNV